MKYRQNRRGKLADKIAPRRQFLARCASAGLFGTAISLAGSLAGPLSPPLSASAQQAAAKTKRISPAAQKAIQRGLAYLVMRQNDDGSFGSGGFGRNVAICSLSGIAFMASGSTPGRGPYGRSIGKCVQYILQNATPSGFIPSPASAASRGPMYGHGFAALFLAEAYGMSRDKQVREKLAKAIELIINTQNKEGGWRYEPRRSEADLSVTICQVMALRAARNAGIHVPNEVMDQCIDYVKRSQNADGGFMYTLQGGGPSQFPRSAAGVVALYSAGIYEGDEISKGLEYLQQHTPQADQARRGGYFFYGHYYAVQAMWHAGGDYWRKWYPAIRDELLAQQREDGSWSDSICSEYGTAMACIILQMPNNYLPIFQR